VVNWPERLAQASQAAGALVMSAADLAAAIFVPWPIAANDRTSHDQAPREMYRDVLNISMQRPKLAAQDICALTDACESTTTCATTQP